MAIYPAASDYATPNEDLIFLRIGRYSGYQLSQMIKGDIEKMVAYSYVTSAEAEATWGESLRYWWLQWSQPTNRNGEYATAKRWSLAGSLWRFFLKAVVNTAIKVALPAAIFALLAYYNRDDILQWLQHTKP